MKNFLKQIGKFILVKLFLWSKKKLFEFADKDKDGYISKEEFEELFVVTEKQLARLIKKIKK